jgi:hypothetical protein
VILLAAFVVFLYSEEHTATPDYTFNGIYIYGSLNFSLGKHVYVIYEGDPGVSELNAQIAKNVPNLVYTLSKKGHNVSTEALVFDNKTGEYLTCVGYENFTVNECLGLVNSSSVIWFKYPSGEKHIRVYLKDDDVIVYPRTVDDYYNITLFLNELILGHFSA